MRLVDLATECEELLGRRCPESTIGDILYRRTREPGHSLGEALKAVHARTLERYAADSARLEGFTETGNPVTRTEENV